MKAALEKLRQVRGLYAAAVFARDGSLIASDGAHPAFANALAAAGQEIAHAFAPERGRRASKWESSILRFDRGTLLIRRGHAHMLVLWGTSALDVTVGGASLHATMTMRAIQDPSRTHTVSGSIPVAHAPERGKAS